MYRVKGTSLEGKLLGWTIEAPQQLGNDAGSNSEFKKGEIGEKVIHGCGAWDPGRRPG